MRAGLDARRFPFLSRLSQGARHELGALASTRVAPRAQLLKRGAAANGVYFVVAGALRVYYIGPTGREATLYHVEPGGTCVLALTSTFNDEPYPAWVDAGRDGADFVRVSSEHAQRLLDTESGFRSFVFGALTGRVLELMRTLEEAGSAQVEQRVARYLVKRREESGEVRVTQAGIASELGTAREVVFRALRSLGERKLIETGRMRIRILDADALRAIAE